MRDAGHLSYILIFLHKVHDFRLIRRVLFFLLASFSTDGPAQNDLPVAPELDLLFGIHATQRVDLSAVASVACPSNVVLNRGPIGRNGPLHHGGVLRR